MLRRRTRWCAILAIIGEAARALPEDLKAEASAVDWRKLIGLRNILVHEYFGVSFPIIWDVAINKLDVLQGLSVMKTARYELSVSAFVFP